MTSLLSVVKINSPEHHRPLNTVKLTLFPLRSPSQEASSTVNVKRRVLDLLTSQAEQQHRSKLSDTAIFNIFSDCNYLHLCPWCFPVLALILRA